MYIRLGPNIYIYICSYIHKYYVHTHSHMRTYTNTHLQTHTCARAYTHTHSPTHSPTHTLVRINTHTHSRTCVRRWRQPSFIIRVLRFTVGRPRCVKRRRLKRAQLLSHNIICPRILLLRPLLFHTVNAATTPNRRLDLIVCVCMCV